MNSYATDGLCHNAEPGTFNHECGKPAMWIGVKGTGFAMGFCGECKRNGSEARLFGRWTPTPRQREMIARDSDRELAARRALQPMKPKKEQRPCDLGLFSDERDQVDLIDLARKAIA